MSISRRQFVHLGAGVAAGSTMFTRPLFGLPMRGAAAPTVGAAAPSDGITPSAPEVLAQYADRAAMRELASKAVDAARQAGATYADARLVRNVTQSFLHQQMVGAEPTDGESLTVGVRALVNGYWGFAASAYWTTDEVTKLAHDAVAQAKLNASAGGRSLELGPAPASKGDWTMPGIDPFTISIEEKVDFMNAWRQAVTDTARADLNIGMGQSQMNFARAERVLVTSDGTSTAQTTYVTSGSFPIAVSPNLANSNKQVTVGPNGLSTAGKGWELFTDAKIRDQIPDMLERGAMFLSLPIKAVEIGRYDVVCDATTMASLTAATIGAATQLDRALGYEANASGTSYLGPNPLDLLGTFQTASSLVSVSGDRSAPGSPTTVAWDDDGVKPEPFTIVKDGILVDYQTTREQAAWLAPWYQRQGMPVRSHGCSGAESAMRAQIQVPPNINLLPGSKAASFDDLVAGTKRGLAIISGGAGVDFQGRSGVVGGLMRDITNGRLGAVRANAGLLFNTVDLWKNVTALGGAASVDSAVQWGFKGQPFQNMYSRATGVPAAIGNANIIDQAHRA